MYSQIFLFDKTSNFLPTKQDFEDSIGSIRVNFLFTQDEKVDHPTTSGPFPLQTFVPINNRYFNMEFTSRVIDIRKEDLFRLVSIFALSSNSNREETSKLKVNFVWLNESITIMRVCTTLLINIS